MCPVSRSSTSRDAPDPLALDPASVCLVGMSVPPHGAPRRMRPALRPPRAARAAQRNRLGGRIRLSCPRDRAQIAVYGYEHGIVRPGRPD